MLYEDLQPYIPSLKRDGITIVPWKDSYKEVLGSFIASGIRYLYVFNMRWIILFSSIIFSVHVAFGQNAFPKYEGYKSLSSFSQDTVRYLQYNWGIKTGGLKTTRFFRIFGR